MGGDKNGLRAVWRISWCGTRFLKYRSCMLHSSLFLPGSLIHTSTLVEFSQNIADNLNRSGTGETNEHGSLRSERG